MIVALLAAAPIASAGDWVVQVESKTLGYYYLVFAPIDGNVVDVNEKHTQPCDENDVVDITIQGSEGTGFGCSDGGDVVDVALLSGETVDSGDTVDISYGGAEWYDSADWVDVGVSNFEMMDDDDTVDVGILNHEAGWWWGHGDTRDTLDVGVMNIESEDARDVVDIGIRNHETEDYGDSIDVAVLNFENPIPPHQGDTLHT